MAATFCGTVFAEWILFQVIVSCQFFFITYNTKDIEVNLVAE